MRVYFVMKWQEGTRQIKFIKLFMLSIISPIRINQLNFIENVGVSLISFIVRDDSFAVDVLNMIEVSVSIILTEKVSLFQSDWKADECLFNEFHYCALI